MKYFRFALLVERAGLTPRRCNEVHWQILGGEFVVNFYPETKRGPRFYVDRAKRGSDGPLSRAIAAAKGAVTVPMRDTTGREQDHKMLRRWQDHVKSGGKLTFEKFASRAKRRERVDTENDVDRRLRRQMANEMFDDLPDGAFFAAAGDTFDLMPEDFIDG